jgi:DNA-binding YbaB/EbfC family protein
MVKVRMTCRHDVRRVSIEPELLVGDKEVLEDLIAAAYNDAAAKAEEVSKQKLGGLAGGLSLPPGMKLPF